MTAIETDNSSRWAQAWPDALAFAAGLAVAWFADWETTDLVWSLWLSSFVVGYSMILWMIFSPAILIARGVASNQSVNFNGKDIPLAALGGTAYLVGALFLLAFFTFHFGGFHFVHSAFLSSFFPLESGLKHPQMPGPALYAEVVRRYWVFLPMAFLAERKAFKLPETKPVDTAVTTEAIAARKAKNNGLTGMMAPYKNVIRMHLLIFFFAFAHFAKLENFLVYAVVYAAYFFPWRLLKKQPATV